MCVQRMENNKYNILIDIHYLHLGGAEMSLIGLLQSLDPDKISVDLFVHSHEGELMDYIPEYVNLLSEIPEYSMIERPLREVVRRGYLRVAFARMKAKLRMSRYVAKNHPADCNAIFGFVGDEVDKVIPDINPGVEYDLAISFLAPHNYVLDHTRAKRKICWIHTDYSTVDVNAELEFPVWGCYDNIISISPDVTKAFLKVFPSLKSKIIVVENIISSSFVRQRAEEFKVNLNCTGSINLLSIGRFSEQKNFDNVPDICKRILDAGLDVKWYIIGFGGAEDLIRKKVAESGMENRVIILGKKENPYPYIKSCDIYVQPSRYEGKSITVREAQILCKPVVVTNYPTASSQIKDGVDGVIVPMDNEGCAKGITQFIKDAEKQEHLIEYLHIHDFGNEAEVDKIYLLLK